MKPKKKRNYVTETCENVNALYACVGSLHQLLQISIIYVHLVFCTSVYFCPAYTYIATCHAVSMHACELVASCSNCSYDHNLCKQAKFATGWSQSWMHPNGLRGLVDHLEANLGPG